MNNAGNSQNRVRATSQHTGAIAQHTTNCRLCLQAGDLCESHIVPECFFDQLYDKTHRYYALSNIEGKRIRLLQKGVREKLLCRRCEQQLSTYEHHARSVFYGGTEISVEELGNDFRVGQIDYRKFKLLLISLLWRLGITSLEYFRGVDLGPKHREKLRQMLLSGNPGEPWEYGCAITGLLHEGKAFPELISPPAWGKVAGHRVYTMAIGGFIFAFVVSSHKADGLVEGFLQRDGQLLISRREFTQIPFLMHLGAEVVAARKGRPLPGTKA